MAKLAPLNAKARAFKQNNTFAQLDHDKTNWQNPCSNCSGRGSVMTSCCSNSECGVCSGYGVANLGPKE